MIKHIYSSSFKVPVIRVILLWNFYFLTSFRKIIKYRISWKSFKMETSCSIWTDGWTDIDRRLKGRTDRQRDSQLGRQLGKYDVANSRFSQFCECVTNTPLRQPKLFRTFSKMCWNTWQCCTLHERGWRGAKSPEYTLCCRLMFSFN